MSFGDAATVGEALRKNPEELLAHVRHNAARFFASLTSLLQPNRRYEVTFYAALGLLSLWWAGIVLSNWRRLPWDLAPRIKSSLDLLAAIGILTAPGGGGSGNLPSLALSVAECRASPVGGSTRLVRSHLATWGGARKRWNRRGHGDWGSPPPAAAVASRKHRDGGPARGGSRYGIPCHTRAVEAPLARGAASAVTRL